MSPETRAFLDAVRTAEDPTPEDEKRVLAGVRVAVATGAVAGAGLGLSKAAKLLGGGVATGVKVGGLVLGLSAAAWIAGAALSAERPARPIAVVPRQAPSPRAAENGPPAALPLAPSPTLAAPRDEPPNVVSGTVSTARPAASAAVTTSSLRGELALLAEVQASLARGDGVTALRQLDEHPSADRRLLAERRAARILALCSLGRAAEAAPLVATFLREHPASVQRTAVERSCAGKATPPR